MFGNAQVVLEGEQQVEAVAEVGAATAVQVDGARNAAGTQVLSLQRARLEQHVEHARVADPAVRQHQVLAQRAHEELRVLADIADTRAHLAGFELLQLDAI